MIRSNWKRFTAWLHRLHSTCRTWFFLKFTTRFRSLRSACRTWLLVTFAAWLRRLRFQYPAVFFIASVALTLAAAVLLALLAASAPAWQNVGQIIAGTVGIFLSCLIGALGTMGMLLAGHVISERGTLKKPGRRFDGN